MCNRTLHSISACLRLISCSCTCRSLFWVVNVCIHFWRHWFSCSARRSWLLWIWFYERAKIFWFCYKLNSTKLNTQCYEHRKMMKVYEFHTFLSCVNRPLLPPAGQSLAVQLENSYSSVCDVFYNMFTCSFITSIFNLDLYQSKSINWHDKIATWCRSRTDTQMCLWSRKEFTWNLSDILNVFVVDF